MTCTDVDARFCSNASMDYPSLTETTCTVCGCSAAAPSNSVLSSPIIEYSTMWGGGGGGGEGEVYGTSRKRCQLAYDMCSSLVELSPN